MFQSVAPRPGKIAFQVEPFPIPNFQVLPEASKVTTLPVAEPVTVSQDIEKQVEDVLAVTSVIKESPFLVATEAGDEVILIEEPVLVTEQAFESAVEDIAQKPSNEEAIVEEAIVEEAVVEEAVVEEAIVEEAIVEDAIVEDAPEIEAIESPVVSDPFATIEAEEVSPQSEFFLESAPREHRPNPFEALEAAANGEPIQNEAITEAAEFYTQPSVEAPIVAQSPAVTSWQPPAPREKSKGRKRGGFFRQ